MELKDSLSYSDFHFDSLTWLSLFVSSLLCFLFLLSLSISLSHTFTIFSTTFCSFPHQIPNSFAIDKWHFAHCLLLLFSFFILLCLLLLPSLCLLCALAACPFAVGQSKVLFVSVSASVSASISVSTCVTFALFALSLSLCLSLSFSFFLSLSVSLSRTVSVSIVFPFSACSTESGLFIHPISFFCVFAYHIYHCAFSCTHTQTHTHTHSQSQPPFTDRQLLCPANCTLAEINQLNVVAKLREFCSFI